MDEETRICPNCGRQVTGRADKRFCCSECKTMFHNRKYRLERKEIYRIDRILKKNRSIIDRLYINGERDIPFHRLYHLGFDFKYLTSFIADSCSTEACVFGCYDYTCAMSSDGRISIERAEPATPR